MNNRLSKIIVACGLLLAVGYGVIEQGKASQLQNDNQTLAKRLKVQADKSKNLDDLNNNLHQTIEKQKQQSAHVAQSKVLNERALNSEPNIREFFKTILTFDNDSYLSRFDDAAKLADKQPIEVFKGTGFDNKKPTQGVESSITDFNFYFDQRLSNKEIVSGLADVKSTNIIAGQTHKVEMLYVVTYDFLMNKVTKIEPKTPIDPAAQ